MRFDLDAKVETSDGEDAGTLQWAIVDPQTNEVTHFVISTDVLFGRAVEVPREHIENASQDGGTVRLQLSKDELEALPSHSPTDYAPPPAGWEPTAAQAFPPGAYLWPSQVPAATAEDAGETGGATGDGAVDVHAETQEQEIGIGKGAMVVDSSGEQVGVVEQLYYEEQGGQMRGVSVRAGGMLQTLFGGGETVEVPARFIEQIGESTLYLNATVAELHAEAADAAV